MTIQLKIEKTEINQPHAVTQQGALLGTGSQSMMLIDVSGIDSGERIEKILAGLSSYHRDLCADKTPKLPTDIALVIFGGWGRGGRDFVMEPGCQMPSRKSRGWDSMHSEISGGSESLKGCRSFDTAFDIDWDSPWIFTITNKEASAPQTHQCWEQAKVLLREGKAHASPILIGIRF